jgi:hypothetical protein
VRRVGLQNSGECADFPLPLALNVTYFLSSQTGADTASQQGVQGLVDVLINALQAYQGQNTPSDFDFGTTIDLAIPKDASN